MTAVALVASAVGGLAAGRAGVAVADRFAPPRPRRLPVQELCTAAACTAVVARFGVGLDVLPPLVAALSLVTLSSVDLRSYRLPDAINLPALGASLLVVGVDSLAAGHRVAVAVSAVSGAFYAAVLWVAHAVRPSALGFGDVKLAATLGVHLGWAAAAQHRSAGAITVDAIALVAYALLGACLVGLATALVVGLLRRRGIDALPDPAQPRQPGGGQRLRDTVIPFGPALCGGAMAAVLLSEALVG